MTDIIEIRLNRFQTVTFNGTAITWTFPGRTKVVPVERIKGVSMKRAGLLPGSFRVIGAGVATKFAFRRRHNEDCLRLRDAVLAAARSDS